MKTIAVAWLDEKDWDRWCAIENPSGAPVDPKFTYDYWRSKMERHCSALEANGIRAVRVVVDPGAFMAWCDERGYRVTDSASLVKARSEYAARQAMPQGSGRYPTRQLLADSN